MSVSEEAVAIIGNGHELEGKVSFSSFCLIQTKRSCLVTEPSGTPPDMDALLDPLVKKRAELLISWSTHVNMESMLALGGQPANGKHLWLHHL